MAIVVFQQLQLLSELSMAGATLQLCSSSMSVQVLLHIAPLSKAFVAAECRTAVRLLADMGAEVIEQVVPLVEVLVTSLLTTDEDLGPLPTPGVEKMKEFIVSA